MRFLIFASCAFAMVSAGASGFLPTQIAHAEDTASLSHGGDFVKKRKTLKGSYTVEQRGNATVIVFSTDFQAAKGPDLKVFLSPNIIADVTGKTAIDGSLSLGELNSTKGAQEYVVPADVNLSDYASVLVHCEQYAILWGGSDL
jgi:hypothetical protein